MLISARILRAHADDLPGARPRLSAREQDREDKILAAGLALMARFGRHALTMAGFALAIRLSPATIRRHFVDLDDLLANILFRHLLAVSRAISQIASDSPDPQRARRAAYLAATRTALNAPTPAHLLLIRERHRLPPDLAETVEQMRDVIGQSLAGPNGAVSLVLLDTPELQAAQIEAMLAALAPPRTIEPAPAPRLSPRAANRSLRTPEQPRSDRARPVEKTGLRGRREGKKVLLR